MNIRDPTLQVRDEIAVRMSNDGQWHGRAGYRTLASMPLSGFLTSILRDVPSLDMAQGGFI